MGWIDLLNKAFPEPKPRKKKKLKNWVENPKHFEYDLNKQQEKRRRIRNKLKEEALIKSKYIYADRESKENKLAREKRVDRKIERIKKKSEEKLKPADDYLTDRIKEADERAFWIWQRKEKKYSEEELAQANNEITNLYETIFERLIRMKYISRDPKIRKEQMDSLSDWIRYLKTMSNTGNDLFKYFVLRSILKYDLYWLDKNEDGSWRVGERSKSTRKVFPIFDPDITPEILSTMRDQMAVLEFEKGSVLDMRVRANDANFQDDSPVYQAMLRGDFREIYFLMKEQIEISRIKDEDMEKREEGKWLEPFSYKNCKNEQEKKKMDFALAKATEYSRGFCIKSPGRAHDYLDVGDVYLYSLNTTIKNKDESTRQVDIPEIAIHVFHNGEINRDEIHGNGPKQAIKKEFLPIAENFIENSNFKNKHEFATRFADAYLAEAIEEKLSKGEGLDKRELRFLYEVHRPAKLFEIVSRKIVGKMDRLRSANLTNYRNSLSLMSQTRPMEVIRTEHLHKVYAQMFDVPVEEVHWHPFSHRNIGPSEVPKNAKVLVCKALELFSRDGLKDKNLKYLVGDLFVGQTATQVNFGELEEVTGKMGFSPHAYTKDFKHLKKIMSIELTEKDKEEISSGKYKMDFPDAFDPRFVNYKY